MRVRNIIISGHIWAAAALFALASFGCDRKPSGGSQAPAPGPQAANTNPDTSRPPSTKPSTLPASSTLWINGVERKFPRARLVVKQDSPTVDLLLLSDDPPEALHSGFYTGNRYFLLMKLSSVDDLAKLPGTDARWQSPGSEWIDAPYAIFLDGDRQVLQPGAWQASFSKVGDALSISIEGKFQAFDNPKQPAPTQVVEVRGSLTVELESTSQTRPADRK